MTERVLQLSTGTILRAVVVALAFTLLIVLREVVAIVLGAVVLTAAITPALKWLDRQGIPRPLGLVGALLVFIAIASGVVAAVLPELIRQLRDLDVDLPNLLERLRTLLGTLGVSLPATFGGTLDANVHSLLDVASSFGGSALEAVQGAGTSLVAILAVFVLTAYFSLSGDGIRGLYRPFVPDEALPFAAKLENRIERRLGRWLRGQLLVSLGVVVVGYVGFVLLDLRYPLLLALIGGLTAFLPAISFVLAGIPAVLAAGTLSPAIVISTALFVAILHQTATLVVLPRIVGPGVHLAPGLVLILLLAGAALGGVLGLLLSVPVAAMVAATMQQLEET